ncbi:transposase [Streptomyces sp. TRM70350]|uniref:transposase n=1 Tax=Streptomyces sp. TRM70350 TaxID=2856165 RepID=UPI001C45DF63|nr:transposase [Streptomyces sp. TRM70350]MBV7698496.1 transposase [Streptomyces sp. TRM70350]
MTGDVLNLTVEGGVLLQEPLVPDGQRPDDLTARSAVTGRVLSAVRVGAQAMVTGFWAMIKSPKRTSSRTRRQPLRVRRARMSSSRRNDETDRREATQTHVWIERVQTEDLPVLHAFVTGLGQDLDTVVTRLSLPYSSGAVEGHNNKIKMLKRQAAPTLTCSANASSSTHEAVHDRGWGDPPWLRHQK